MEKQPTQKFGENPEVESDKAQPEKNSEPIINPGKIFKAISKIMADMGAVAKTQQNTQQGFKFRGIDDVYNALQKVMAKHEVFTIPRILDRKRKDVVSSRGAKGVHALTQFKFIFYCSDGSFITAEADGEGIDYGDKVSNKCAAIAHKYALTQVFCVPYKDNDDPDKTSHDIKPQPKPKQATQKPKAKPPTVYKNGINSNQLGAFFKLTGKRKWTNDHVKEILIARFRLETPKDLYPDRLKEFSDLVKNHTCEDVVQMLEQEAANPTGPTIYDDDLSF